MRGKVIEDGCHIASYSYSKKISVDIATLHNVFAVHRTVCSTLGHVQYTGGYHEDSGGYHEKTWGCSGHWGVIMSKVGETVSTLGDTVSTLGAYHDECWDIISTLGDV